MELEPILLSGIRGEQDLNRFLDTSLSLDDES